jgi:F-type H+-transporting ATPase subunit gamma
MKDPLTTAESRKIVRFIVEEWKTGQYEKISIIYNQYVSAITQLPVIKTLFPIVRDDIMNFLSEILSAEYTPSHENVEYTIEPDITTIVEYTIPMILDAIVHETLLEAKASEHASRMVAMKNAKDSANKKAKSLTLVYNKARQ